MLRASVDSPVPPFSCGRAATRWTEDRLAQGREGNKRAVLEKENLTDRRYASIAGDRPQVADQGERRKRPGFRLPPTSQSCP